MNQSNREPDGKKKNWQLSVHQEHELLLSLENAGLDKQVAQVIIEKPEVASRIVESVRDRGTGFGIDLKIAAEIMGPDFIGPNELSEIFGEDLIQDDLSKIPKIPFTERALCACSGSHILFLGMNCLGVTKEGNKNPLTMCNLMETFPDNFHSRLDDSLWNFRKHGWFTETTPKFDWYMMMKKPLKNPNKCIPEAIKLVRDSHYIGSAVVYTYALLLMNFSEHVEVPVIDYYPNSISIITSDTWPDQKVCAGSDETRDEVVCLISNSKNTKEKEPYIYVFPTAETTSSQYSPCPIKKHDF